MMAGSALLIARSEKVGSDEAQNPRKKTKLGRVARDGALISSVLMPAKGL